MKTRECYATNTQQLQLSHLFRYLSLERAQVSKVSDPESILSSVKTTATAAMAATTVTTTTTTTTMMIEKGRKYISLINMPMFPPFYVLPTWSTYSLLWLRNRQCLRASTSSYQRDDSRLPNENFAQITRGK